MLKRTPRSSFDYDHIFRPIARNHDAKLLGGTDYLDRPCCYAHTPYLWESVPCRFHEQYAEVGSVQHNLGNQPKIRSSYLRRFHFPPPPFRFSSSTSSQVCSRCNVRTAYNT